MITFPPYATRTASFAGALADDDAIKTSIATDDEDPHTYEDSDLDGALGEGPFVLLRNVTVTTSSNAATYNIEDPIIVTGVDGLGNEITEELLLTEDGGGETIEGTKGFKSITSIEVPVQDDPGGSFKFGVLHVFIPDLVREVRVGTSGSLKVTYGDGTVDTIPSVANQEKLSISPVKIWGSTTTAQNITVMF